MRFYIQYAVDAGQLMMGHDVIEAASWKQAMATWPQKVRGSVAHRGSRPFACFELPRYMSNWDNKAVLDHYASSDFEDQFTTPGKTGRPWFVRLWQTLARR
ncbi:hypothetical protein [Mesorhizobium sp.]|uniref:hypothetical protein n=1 Tax=Mesorhizobium sp. TaxID=1871066 RepID=UPI000FEA895D|nr:hypothetical protein [Mesorhizobium sp.]RWI35500.1 MAG: hypothetical protein EOR14_28775 [Mesorhizobium sp.]RWJ66331.1 MAG: hypothetical protein EOR34_28360 [Mesorhizobium sp.]